MKRSEQVELVRESLRRFNRRAGVLKADPYGIGLSLSQCSALVDIGRTGTLKANDLVRLLNLEKSSVSRLLAVLGKSGLITVTAAPDDGRSKLLKLTTAGKEKVEIINRASNNSVIEAFEFLSRKERDEVVSAFVVLSKAVSKVDRPKSTTPVAPS